jgi:prolyl 4-hydroxylase
MRKESLVGEDIFLIHEFFSPEECERHIQLSEATGFGEAPINSVLGAERRPQVRNNDRVIIDDIELATTLWPRAMPFVPERFRFWRTIGLNERFRYYRYDVGQRFVPHYDGYFERENGQRSVMTFMVYLNEGFGGGQTKFYFSPEKLIVTPQTGTALIFPHQVLHEGAPVESGRKYVLRSDVMGDRRG